MSAHRHTPLELYGDDWVEQPTRHANGDGDYRGLRSADTAATIGEGRPHRANGALALHVLEVVETLLDSAAAGRAVEMTATCERPAPLAPGATGQIE